MTRRATAPNWRSLHVARLFVRSIAPVAPRHNCVILIAVTRVLAAKAFYRFASPSCLGIALNEPALATEASGVDESIAGQAIAARHEAWAAADAERGCRALVVRRVPADGPPHGPVRPLRIALAQCRLASGRQFA